MGGFTVFMLKRYVPLVIRTQRKTILTIYTKRQDWAYISCAGRGVWPWKVNYSNPPAVSFRCLMLVCLHCAVYIFKHHFYKELFSGFTAINRCIKQIWWVYIIFLTCTSHLTSKLSRSKLHIMFVPVLSNFSQLYQMSFHIQYTFGNLHRVISR